MYFVLIVSTILPVFATNIEGVSISPNMTNTGVEDPGNRVIGILKVVGILVSVGILIVLGIKYMMGSAEEKAEYKKTFIPYIVGAILVFAASNLASMIYSWANQVTTA